MLSVRGRPWSCKWPASSTDEHTIDQGPGLWEATVNFQELTGALVVATVVVTDSKERTIAVCQGRTESVRVVFATDGGATIKVTNNTGPISINAIPRF